MIGWNPFGHSIAPPIQHQFEHSMIKPSLKVDFGDKIYNEANMCHFLVVYKNLLAYLNVLQEYRLSRLVAYKIVY